MKNILGVLLSLFLLASSLPAQAPLPAAPPPRDSAATAPAAAIATELIDRLAKGDFQAAAGNFADAMKAAAPPEKLSEIWTSLQVQMGTYKRRAGVRAAKQGQYDVGFVTVEFEHNTIEFKIVVDGAGKIAGFSIVPPQQAAAQAPAPAGPEYSPPSYSTRMPSGSGR